MQNESLLSLTYLDYVSLIKHVHVYVLMCSIRNTHSKGRNEAWCLAVGNYSIHMSEPRNRRVKENKDKISDINNSHQEYTLIL